MLYEDIVAGYHAIKNNNTYSNVILITIEEIRGIIKYIIKSRDELAIIFVNDREQTLFNEDIVKNKTKKKVIDEIMEKVPSIVSHKEYFYEALAADLNNKLFFNSEETLEKLKEVLYDAFMKTDFNDDELDVWQTNYTESLADIAMCFNLQLDVMEYLIFISHIYRQYDISSLEKIRRIILVINVLYCNANNKDATTEETDVCDIGFTRYVSELAGIKELIQKPESKLTQNGKDILQLHREIVNNLFIVNNTTYNIILSSLRETCKNIKFLDDEQIKNLTFVKSYLRNKLSENPSNQDIEKKEIDFIFKYYYKTRTKYHN